MRAGNVAAHESDTLLHAAGTGEERRHSEKRIRSGADERPPSKISHIYLKQQVKTIGFL